MSLYQNVSQYMENMSADDRLLLDTEFVRNDISAKYHQINNLEKRIETAKGWEDCSEHVVKVMEMVLNTLRNDLKILQSRFDYLLSRVNDPVGYTCLEDH